MQPDNEAPAEIFTWLEKTGFDSLSSYQKEKVLLFFSEAEYEGMHFAMRSIESTRTADRKAALLQHFERQRGSGPVARVIPAGWVWRAAAVLLPLAMLAVFFLLRNGEGLEDEKHVQLADTVYIRTEVAGSREVVHDTVYLTRTVVHASAEERPAQRHQQAAAPVAPVAEDMQGLSFSQLQSISNATKRNSLLHDSLWRSFEPVAL